MYARRWQHGVHRCDSDQHTDPAVFPVGGLSVFWVRDGGPNGADVGHSAPARCSTRRNLICTDTPPALPADPITRELHSPLTCNGGQTAFEEFRLLPRGQATA